MVFIKTENDIKGIRESCRVVSSVLEELKGFIKKGVSTLEVETFAHNIIKKNGAKSAFKGYSIPGLPPFPGQVCTSVNSCIVHGIPTSKMTLKDGDIIGVDVGVIKNGYYGDAAMTYAVGNISAEAKKLMYVTQESLFKGIAQVKSGNKVGDISSSIGSLIHKNGYFVADSLSGHGVGIKLHEEPMIPNSGERGTGMLLKPGMTIAIEPMVNIGTNKVKEKGWEYFSADGSLSAHYEHTVLVTDADPQILTVYN